jgi:hypothetical protein
MQHFDHEKVQQKAPCKNNATEKRKFDKFHLDLAKPLKSHNKLIQTPACRFQEDSYLSNLPFKPCEE